MLKKNLRNYLILTILVLCSSASYSKTQSSFAISGGLSLPNKEVKNIFNSNRISTADTNNPFLYINIPDGNSGYSLSAKLLFDLTESASFFGGFALSGFSTDVHNLQNPTDNSEKGVLEIKSSIYSINAGMHYYLYDDFIGIYGIGDLSYNFLASSITKIETSATLRLPNNPTDSRIGFTLGLGFEIPLEQFSIILEGKYSELNYIGKVTNEQSKSLILIQAGFRF